MKMNSKVTVKVCLLLLIPLVVTLTEAKLSLAASSIDGNFGWKITKTGIEENLDVDYRIINETTTSFTINFPEGKGKYANLLSQEGDSTSDIPVSKLKGRIDLPTKLDFTQDEVSFYVTYDNLFDGDKSFKIGKHSVLVNNSAETDATTGVAPNIYVDIYGCLNVAYTDGTGDDLGFGRSCDQGNTWTTAQPTIGTFQNVGILGNSTGGLLIYYADLASGDISAVTSNNNGTTWSTVFDIMNSETVVEPSCAIDGLDRVFCCGIDTDVTANYNLFVVNSTSWANELSIKAVGTSNLISCDIEVGYDNCAYVSSVDRTGGDFLYLYSSCNGWAETTVSSLGSDMNRANYMSIANISGSQEMMIIYPNSSSNTIDYCINNTGTWICCKVINSSIKNIEGVFNQYNQSIFLSTSSTTTGGGTNITNSSDFNTWTTSHLASLADYPSIADQVWPSTAKMKDTAHIVFTNASGVWYTSVLLYNDSTSGGSQSYANEEEGDNAIDLAISSSEIGVTATTYSSQQIAARNAVNSQFTGRFDKFVVNGNKRWAFSYISTGESSISGSFNITPSLYVLQLENLTTQQITDQVGKLINTTWP